MRTFLLTILLCLVAACSDDDSDNKDTAASDENEEDDNENDTSEGDDESTDEGGDDENTDGTGSHDQEDTGEPDDDNDSSQGQGQGSACRSADDCTLYSDCCRCLSASPLHDPMPCDLFECFVDTCAAMQVTAVLCVQGDCVLDIRCDSSGVMCRMATPECPEGESPIVDQEGSCWTGGCVLTSECSDLTS